MIGPTFVIKSRPWQGKLNFHPPKPTLLTSNGLGLEIFFLGTLIACDFRPIDNIFKKLICVTILGLLAPPWVFQCLKVHLGIPETVIISVSSIIWCHTLVSDRHCNSYPFLLCWSPLNARHFCIRNNFLLVPTSQMSHGLRVKTDKVKVVSPRGH